jgi:hypothetical protein
MAESCLRKFDIERYSAGELTGAAAAGLEEHLGSCTACGAYLATVQKERKEFLQAHPYQEFLATHAAPIGGAPWYKKLPSVIPYPALRPVLLPAVCVILVAVTVVPFLAKRGEMPGSDILYKSAPGNGAALSYIYKRGDVIHTGSPDDLFRPGDKVQIFYSSAADRSLSLLSIDGNGAVSFYQPDSRSATCSIRSGTGSKLAYPVSIELDSTTGAELVVAVFSDKAFDTNQIKKWVAGLKVKGDLPALEKAVKSNPPENKSSVLTLMLKKG